MKVYAKVVVLAAGVVAVALELLAGAGPTEVNATGLLTIAGVCAV